jgi:hypothetical protein
VVAAVAVVAAAVAVVAAAEAVAAEAAVVAAVAVAAVSPGAVAVFAKHDTPTYLINASGHGRVRSHRPGQSMSRLRYGPHARVGEIANIGCKY